MHQAFTPLLKNKLLSILAATSAEGFHTLLVGGVVRDYLFSQEISNDIDLEIIPAETFIDESIYMIKLSQLLNRLEKIENVTILKLKFNIIRLIFSDADFEIEIAPARIEIYQDTNANEIGHSDFDIKLMLSDGPLQAALRRDFTINAISYLLKINQSGELQTQERDPLHGKDDMENKVLRECSKGHFTYDPVRMLRLIRFQLQLKFTPASSVTSLMSSFGLEKLTDFYFYKEAFKVNFFEFIFNFYKMIDKNKLKMNSVFDTLELINSELKKKNLYPRLSTCSPQNKFEVILTLLIFIENKKLVEQYSNQIQVKKKVFKKLKLIGERYCLINKDKRKSLQQQASFEPYSSYLLSFS